jgi:serine protease SohB
MIDMLLDTLAFVVKSLVVFLTVAACAAVIFSRARGLRSARGEGRMQVRKLNDRLRALAEQLRQAMLPRREQRKRVRALAKQEKQHERAEPVARPSVFVLDFKGDLLATAVESLREEVNAVVSVAGTGDEVVLRLESPGGAAHSYGLAASQLVRLKSRGVKLTVCVDKVAASGGYMMACVADQILTAPFAVLGSIGVAAPLPNAHRLLERHGIDYEEVTAGEYKRTVSYLGKITDKGKQKFQEQIDDMHRLFKEFVRQNRPAVDVEQVATGEHWYGLRAIELGLANAVATSDDYLMGKVESCDIYQLWYERPRSVRNRIASTMRLAGERFADGLWSRLGASAPP